jgi:hypothetical protein
MFTCSAICDIYIDILHSLETGAFINALIRFISRRGVPQLIGSDNGTNFIGAAKEYLDALRKCMILINCITTCCTRKLSRFSINQQHPTWVEFGSD